MASRNQRLGKYFYIRCKHKPDYVLEIQDAVDRPGIHVVTSEVRDELDGNDHQQWYTDQATETIRNKLNGYCMDVRDSVLFAYPYQTGSSSQQWLLNNDKLQSHDDFETVLGVADDSDELGAEIHSGADESRAGQEWIKDNRPAQCFYIRMQDSPEKVMDVAKASSKPGAKVIIYQDKGKMDDNQLWYEDEEGLIHSKMTGFVMDTSGKEAIMLPYDVSNPNMQWVISGNTVVSRQDPSMVLQPKKAGMFSAPSIQAAQYDSSPEQMWTFDYLPDQSLSLNHGGNGKHFFLRNRWCGLVMALSDTSGDPGTEVVTSYRSPDIKSSDDQLFYQDEPSGTIRSALNNYCLDIRGGVMVMNPYDPYNKHQQWRKFGKKVQNRSNITQVIQVSDASMEPGASVVPANYSGEEEQHWEVTHIAARCFHIASQMHSKVIEVKGAAAVAGTKLIMNERQGTMAANQLWYEDERGVIRSKLNGYVMDGSEKSSQLVLAPYDPTNELQQWVIIGDRIQNRINSKLVLDIQGAKSHNGAFILPYKFHGADNQKWKFEYV